MSRPLKISPVDFKWQVCLQKLQVSATLKSYFMEFKYTPRVGDKVIITKSDLNWGHLMDQFVGQEKIISKVYDSDYNSKPVTFVVFDKEEHEGVDDIGYINNWNWSHEHGHFKLSVPSGGKKTLKLKLKV